MQNVRNIDVLVSVMDCTDVMLKDIDDEETMFDGFATLRKLCSMLPLELCETISGVFDLSEAIESAENEFLGEGNIDKLIVLISKIYGFGSAASKMYKMLASPAFTESFIPVTV